jgi:hypothetical protein
MSLPEEPVSALLQLIYHFSTHLDSSRDCAKHSSRTESVNRRGHREPIEILPSSHSRRAFLDGWITVPAKEGFLAVPQHICVKHANTSTRSRICSFPSGIKNGIACFASGVATVAEHSHF